MQITKSQFADNELRIIYDLCKLIYGLKNKEEVERVFGLTYEQLEKVINQIVNSLPDDLLKADMKKVREMEQIFAKEFIFFQVQEKTDDPQYQKDVANFVTIFSRDIGLKLKLSKEEQLK